VDTGQLNRSGGELWMVPVRFCVLLLINLMLVPLTNTPDEFLFSAFFQFNMAFSKGRFWRRVPDKLDGYRNR